MIVRKTLFIRELLSSDEMGRPCPPITRVAAMAVVRNPFAGQDQNDLSDLFEIAVELGPSMAAELRAMLPNAPVSYGKAALVGTAGAMEHGAAVLHPKLGAPVRAAIGGDQALMPSNHNVGAMGDRIDLPLGHKDDPWSFDFIDTMTLSIADAPRADVLILCIALSDGTRSPKGRSETTRQVTALPCPFQRRDVYRRGASPEIISIIKRVVNSMAHSKLGCDKSPILLKSKENGHGPHRAGFA